MIGVPDKNERNCGRNVAKRPGQTGWRSVLPTVLPRPRRHVESKKQSVASLIFNTFLVVSALLLTFIVLVREEEYALAQPDDPTQITADSPHAAPDIGEQMRIPPG